MRAQNLIFLNTDLTSEDYDYNSLSFIEKLKKIRFRDSSDKRHYGRCIPLFYINTRPVIVFGGDWYFQIITLGILIFFYFTSFSNIFICTKWYKTSDTFFHILRVLHFISFFLASCTNPGFAHKISLEEFNLDFKNINLITIRDKFSRY